MAAKKSARSPSKSDYIRAQPASMTPNEVVAKAAAEGLKMSRNLVYLVRQRAAADAKGSLKKTSATKAPKKATPKETPKANAAPRKSTESKADFVRERSHLSPKEIVEDANAAGMQFDAGYVYDVRSYDNKKAKKKRAAKKSAATVKAAAKAAVTKPMATAPTSKPSAANGTGRTTSSVEDLLRAAAAELGLGRAIEILRAERARVRALIGG